MLSEAEVIEELTGAGATIADYFLIAGALHCVNQRGELLGVAADDELSLAMVAYLRRVGVTEYTSEEAYRLQAHRRDWDRILNLYRESLGTVNGGYLGPMLDLVTELRVAPPACLLIPSTSHHRLVVAQLPPTVFPRPYVCATLLPTTGHIEIRYSRGQHEVTAVSQCDRTGAGPLFQALLSCAFGDPVSPAALHPAWRTPTVTLLATAADEDRTLPSGELDPARLAVLADALEEAGCTNRAILEHLRGPGPHSRGCFAVDLVLSKE
jgi:hypothetical protein